MSVKSVQNKNKITTMKKQNTKTCIVIKYQAIHVLTVIKHTSYNEISKFSKILQFYLL